MPSGALLSGALLSGVVLPDTLPDPLSPEESSPQAAMEKTIAEANNKANAFFFIIFLLSIDLLHIMLALRYVYLYTIRDCMQPT